MKNGYDPNGTIGDIALFIYLYFNWRKKAMLNIFFIIFFDLAHDTLLKGFDECLI